MRDIRLSVPWYAIITGALFVGPIAHAQDPKLDQLGKDNQNFGMDSAAFRQLFGSALRGRQAPALPAATVEQLADQVSEVRIFLTDRTNTAIGEVAVAGKTSLTEISLTLEAAPVRLLDTGRPPDRKKGDGIFTAEIRMDTDSAWRSVRTALAGSGRLTAPGEKQFVRRGPRDIIPAKDALEALRTQDPGALKALSDRGRIDRIARARTPSEAARVAQIDITRTPFITIPLLPPARPTRFQFRRAFDIPVIDFFPLPPLPLPIDEEKSLMIIDAGVVDDGTRSFDPCANTGTAGGPWSFGHLMRELSNGTGMTPEDFTMHWLSNWILLQEANGFLVNEPGRAAALQSLIISSWQTLSGATLKVDRFPARLLAIVNRPDLADKIGYGAAGSAGEGRFVFGLLRTPPRECATLPFTVIFEYGVKGGSCSAVKAWHQRWKNLDAHQVGSAPYNAALELITRDFTDHGSNPTQFPNQSSLNQLRTNENALDPLWQLREFRLQTAGAVPPGLFDLVTVKQTPDDGFRNGSVGTPTVAAYILGAEADILANKHAVPERFPGIFNRFMGARSNVPFPPSSVFWNAPGLTAPPMTDPAEARRKFSLSTCNACHGGETNTIFTHIGNLGQRAPGSDAALSGFLTGIDVTVPVTGGIHHYADLAEREVAMSNILTAPCFALAGVRRIPFVH